METWGPVLLENLPVAVVLIYMTKMWLTFLRERDKTTLDTFKDISDAADETTRSTRDSINRNTEVLTGVRTLIEERMRARE